MKTAPLRIAVTGASGYIGSHLVARLQAAGMEVIALSRRAASGDRWQLGDAARLNGADVLVHCAFDFRHYEANVPGVLRLMESASVARVDGIVHLSSMSAFPGCASAYGRTKLAIEELVQAHNGVSIRSATVWGGNVGGPVGSITNVVRKSPIVPWFTGCEPLRLVHVDDLVTAIQDAIEHRDRLRGRVFSVASGDVVRFDQLVQILAARLGLRRLLVPVPALLVQWMLDIAERLGIRGPLRADSLRDLRHANPSPDLQLPDVVTRPARSLIRGDPD